MYDAGMTLFPFFPLVLDGCLTGFVWIDDVLPMPLT